MDLDELVLAYQMNNTKITYMCGASSVLRIVMFSRIKVHTCHLKLDLNLFDQNNGRPTICYVKGKKGKSRGGR